MYGRYREDLGQFALTEARKNSLATAGTVKQSSSGSEDEKQSVAGTTTTKSRKKGSTWKIKRTLAGTSTLLLIRLTHSDIFIYKHLFIDIHITCASLLAPGCTNRLSQLRVESNLRSSWRGESITVTTTVTLALVAVAID